MSSFNRLIFSFFCSGILLLTVSEASYAREKSEVIYAFRNYSAASPQKMLLVGEIKSKTKEARAYEKDSPYQMYDTRLDQVTVRVVNRSGLKVGQKLYIIDKNPHHKKFRNGLIVGEIEVDAILNNPFYGWVLTGKGILLRVREGQFVARTLQTENLDNARLLKKRADRSRSQGRTEEAIQRYQKALAQDNALPEAHAALGALFLEEAEKTGELPVRAASELDLAFKYRNNFEYKSDRFDFYKDYMQAHYSVYRQQKHTLARGSNMNIHINKIIRAADECVQMTTHPDCRLHRVRAYYEAMEYYSPQTTAEDRKNYDEYREKTAADLKWLNDNLYGFDRFTASMRNFRNAELKAADTGLSAGEYHRTGALFYHELLGELPKNGMETKQKELTDLVQYHLDQFSRYYPQKNDPEIEVVREALNR